MKQIFFLSPFIFLNLTSCEKAQNESLPPPNVTITQPSFENIEQKREWVGTVVGSISTTINAQVTGYLKSQIYKNGQFVKKGELLFEIDSRLFEDALNLAKANLASAIALQVEAQETENRYRPLVKLMAISRQNYDNAVQQNLSAKAQVVAAQAAVATAQQNLEFCRITAPISGIVGFATAQIGDLVSPTSGMLAQIAQVDPIRVDFSIGEQEFLKLAQKSKDGSAQLPENLSLELILADGKVYPHKGYPFATNLQVQSTTGTISIESLFPNPERLIRPGMFASVKARTGFYPNALVIPQKAVKQYMTATLVAVVNDQNVIEMRPVKLGVTQGLNWMVLDGLKKTDKIVLEGPLQMQTGMKVNPINKIN